MRTKFLAASLLLTVLSIGCGPQPSTPPTANTPTPPNTGSSIANAVQQAQKSIPANSPAATPSTAPATPPPATVGSPAPTANTETVLAQPGVGIKGRSLDAHEGIVVTPVKQYFRAKELAVFTIQVPQALNLFKATDSQGQGPKSHEDYMREVIESNNIKLPELPPGHRYLYDPKTEELTVVRPKPTP